LDCQRGREFFKHIKTGNFPNLVNDIDMQGQKDQMSLLRFNSAKSTPGHAIIKVSKVKHKDSQGAKGKQNMKGCPNSPDSTLLSTNVIGQERVG
jgi:hypothetical protein